MRTSCSGKWVIGAVVGVLLVGDFVETIDFR